VPLLWRHYATEIAEALSPLELVQVAGPEEAEAAAFDAAVLGFSRIVAVGGSAVAHGLVNGIMRLAEGHRRRMKIGFLSLGQRGPWARTVGLPSALTRQLEILAAGHTLPYDVGRLECRDAAGATLTRHFLLGAACGPLSASWSLAMLPPLRMARIAGSVLGAGARCLTGRTPQVALEVDGREVYRGPWALGLVMGGRHYPLFGETAPEANPSDGTLDVAWIPAASVAGMAGHVLGLWLGGDVLGGGVLPEPPRCQGSEIRIVPLGGAEERPQSIEADGVPAGFLPATVRVLPRTLPVIVEAVAARLRERTRAAADIPAAAFAGSLRAVGLRKASVRRMRWRRQAWASASR
jgi:diacylglycerol kinase family enzyme